MLLLIKRKQKKKKHEFWGTKCTPMRLLFIFKSVPYDTMNSVPVTLKHSFMNVVPSSFSYSLLLFSRCRSATTPFSLWMGKMFRDMGKINRDSVNETAVWKWCGIGSADKVTSGGENRSLFLSGAEEISLQESALRRFRFYFSFDFDARQGRLGVQQGPSPVQHPFGVASEILSRAVLPSKWAKLSPFLFVR